MTLSPLVAYRYKLLEEELKGTISNKLILGFEFGCVKVKTRIIG